jgi:hypothetical protein
VAILKVFLHIFDQDRLSHMLGEWTPDISLAVAVSEEGAVHLQLHHVAETNSLPAIIVRRFGIREGDLVVSQDAPEALRNLVGDVRKVKFSEEKRLIDLVMARPALQEDAADYAINFSFAQEEGIDLQTSAEIASDGFGEFPEKLFLTDGSSDGATDPGFLHFRANEDAMRWCGVMPGSSQAVEQGLLVTCGDRGAKAPRRILLADVSHREDLSELISPRDDLETWRHPDPLEITIPWKLLAEGTRAFAGRPVTIKFSPWWIVICLDLSPGEDALTAAERNASAASPRRKFRRLSPVVLSTAISTVVATTISLGVAGATPELRKSVRDHLSPLSTFLERISQQNSDGDADIDAGSVKIRVSAIPDQDPLDEANETGSAVDAGLISMEEVALPLTLFSPAAGLDIGDVLVSDPGPVTTFEGSEPDAPASTTNPDEATEPPSRIDLDGRDDGMASSEGME